MTATSAWRPADVLRRVRLPSPDRGTLLWFGVALVIYAIAAHHRSITFVPYLYMADALLHGRLSVDSVPADFIEVITVGSRHYFAYGVMPAVVLMPLVALFGVGISQGAIAVALGAVNVALMYRLLVRLEFSPSGRTWLTVLFAFGTVHFHGSVWGTTWFLMHLVAITFLLLAVNETLGQRRWFLVGLMFGCSVLSRNAVLLAAPFFMLHAWRRESRWSALLAFGAGLAPCLLLNMWYNLARFGSVSDNGYGRLFSQPYGMFSFHYLPANLRTYFLAPPDRLGEAPWLRPSLHGMSLFLTTPAFLYILRAWRRDTLTIGSWLAVAGVGGLYLLYFWDGFAQFGVRYSLDFTVFLLLLTAIGIGPVPGRLARVLILLSIIVNLWGIWWWRYGGLGRT